MLLDHIYQFLYMYNVPLVFTLVGRVVAPIFLFLATESFFYTRSRIRYMLKLYVGFLIMASANMYINRYFGLVKVNLYNNVFATLFLTTFIIYIIEGFINSIKNKSFIGVLKYILLLSIPVVTKLFFMLSNDVDSLFIYRVYLLVVFPIAPYVEGGYLFLLLGVALYYLRKNRILQVLAIIVASLPDFYNGSYQCLMVFSAIFILLYNGEKGRGMKWLFYIFYPVHIYLLYALSYFMQVYLNI